ncbi:hypothetical protein CR513_44652, partial [Mucuna pruriens]
MVDEGCNSMEQGESIIRIWIEQMKHVTFSFCLYHVHNTVPPNVLQQFLIIPTPILEQIILSNRNQHSLASQLPQIRILGRVHQRVVGSGRGWASKTPQSINQGKLFGLLGLRSNSLQAPKVRMHQSNSLKVHPRKPVGPNPNTHVVCDVCSRTVPCEKHLPEINVAVEPLLRPVSI